MIFNPWVHIRIAGSLVMLIGTFLGSWPLLLFGVGLLVTGVVGGIDLTERRVALLEKIMLEDTDEKVDKN